MDTRFLLLAEFKTGDIPLELIAQKYFSHDKKKMQREARVKSYPFPIFRGNEKQKSQWLVSVDHLATYLDEQKAEAEKQFKAMNGSH